LASGEIVLWTHKNNPENKMKLILALIVGLTFLISTPVFAAEDGDKTEEKKKEKKKKKEEK
jgi:hypothetical protein